MSTLATVRDRLEGHMDNWSDYVGYFVCSDVTVFFCTGVYHAAFESICQTYVSEEPPLYLHGIIMSILGPPIKPESCYKHIQLW